MDLSLWEPPLLYFSFHCLVSLYHWVVNSAPKGCVFRSLNVPVHISRAAFRFWLIIDFSVNSRHRFTDLFFRRRKSSLLERYYLSGGLRNSVHVGIALMIVVYKSCWYSWLMNFSRLSRVWGSLSIICIVQIIVRWRVCAYRLQTGSFYVMPLLSFLLMGWILPL